MDFVPPPRLNNHNNHSIHNTTPSPPPCTKRKKRAQQHPPCRHPSNKNHQPRSMTLFPSSWESRNGIDLLTHALSQFAQVEHKREARAWAEQRVRDMKLAHMELTMEQLETACREQQTTTTIRNSLLSQISGAEPFLPADTLTRLDRFLQGPCGRKCFQLAKEAVERVENGTGDTNYVHRQNAISVVGEIWNVNMEDTCTTNWTMHVDCAGLIRNLLGTILKEQPDVVCGACCLSDRPFMRAKDFYTYFERLPCTISDLGSSTSTTTTTDWQWRRVDDMRRLLPGDIMAYRSLGRAAGGAAFTNKEDEDTQVIFTAMKAAQLYEQVDEVEGSVSRDLTRDAAVKEWVADICGALEPIGIVDYNSLKENMDKVKELLEQRGESENIFELLDEVMDSNQSNTGHMMVCAGPAEPNATNPYQFRVPVFHSTQSKFKPGVQRGYKRIVATSKDYKVWQRNVGDDDVYGDNDVFVNAARMAF
jgi:hypothetical protein